jgi:hypothetical protein
MFETTNHVLTYKVRHVRIDVLAMAEGSTDFARNLAGENGRAVRHCALEGVFSPRSGG